MKIAVLGAGVVGVSSAWYLARAGFDVTVIDRQPGVGLETSFANGGQIAVSHAEPWANPSTPLKALSWLGREDAPLLFRLRADPALLGWTLRFLRECLPGRARRNIRHIVALANYSRLCLGRLRHELATQGGLQYDHLEKGILHFYTDADEYRRAMHAARIMREFGCNRRLLGVDECVALEPALAASAASLVGGDYTTEDESGDAHVFTRQLAAHCRRVGVQFRLGESIRALDSAQGVVKGVLTAAGERIEADAYVVALGSYSPLLLRPLGLNIPVYPAKGYSATLALSADSVAPTVSLTDDGHKLVFSRLGNRLRVAGTAEFSGYDLSPNPARSDALLERTRSLFPSLNEAAEPEVWCGLRPVTPSSVPLIGRTGLPNLWLNTGHGTLGWTMACGSGAVLADLVGGREPAVSFPFVGRADASGELCAELSVQR
ncbi:D-amino acid dehydrogenase [Azoarcus sp. L1K30]|uniref:D-amino acid dehydrogenase n=1 Tax=Azoarcus sp. L1K30 TaxID=2820277 RepID=UPI001B835A3B|nr:D-amino acid dehydrogenase [Azoarcus sp. L1K30]MBR0565409.1 D-amino acid dehydrogenase [Azoarcus sp. L1K30]